MRIFFTTIYLNFKLLGWKFQILGKQKQKVLNWIINDFPHGWVCTLLVLTMFDYWTLFFTWIFLLEHHSTNFFCNNIVVEGTPFSLIWSKLGYLVSCEKWCLLCVLDGLVHLCYVLCSMIERKVEVSTWGYLVLCEKC